MGRPPLVAIGSAFAALVIGRVVERWVTSVVRPTAGELNWISDLVLAIGFGFVLDFWLNLRAARAVLDAERSGIVLDTQLAVAATIQRGLLPPLPASRHGFSWAVQLATAGRIGGDYYVDRAVAALAHGATAAMLCASVFQLSEGPAPVEGWDDDRTAIVLAAD